MTDEYRDFIRRNHPDRGATRGLRGRARRTAGPPRRALRRPGGGRGPARGVVARVRRWYDRRFRKPRVR
ncbi:hypothetical protein ACFQV2_10520 [Actinokineospora soli]|uniref:Uncharacterized protein n=1 Tax=Actinokineospora soli TaxID=1048753 RepID=A0ABW2TJH9_9PSEU